MKSIVRLFKDILSEKTNKKKHRTGECAGSHLFRDHLRKNTMFAEGGHG